MDILSFGEIIWDVYPTKSTIGGAPLNFVAHAVQCGANGFLLSSVGDDALGKQATERLEKFGVSGKYVSTNNKQTGKCQVSLDINGVPTYHVLQDVAYDYIKLDPTLLARGFDLLAFGTLALRGNSNREVLQKLLQQGNFKMIYCDLNLRAPFYNKEVIEFCLGNCDVVKISDNELSFLCDEVLRCGKLSVQNFAKRLAKAYSNLKTVLVTCGGEGSCAYDVCSDEIYWQEAIKTEVVSTVGAGDSFGGAFITSLLKGKNLATCLYDGAVKSAKVVAVSEAVPQ